MGPTSSTARFNKMISRGLGGRVFPLLLLLLADGCARRLQTPSLSPQDSLRIVGQILTHRAEADSFFRSSPDSPFNRDTTIRYRGISWYPPDVRFTVRSLLFRYANPESVTVGGTKGEERRVVKYGYFIIPFEG